MEYLRPKQERIEPETRELNTNESVPDAATGYPDNCGLMPKHCCIL